MDFRHEWKHEISFSDMIVLRQRLGAVMERDEHAVDGKYFIRSLYFDNAADKALREKLDGVNNREKFRIRYYDHDPSLIHLEKKSKRNGLTYVLFGICSTVLLAHESGHVWKYKWMKVPVGILSIVYIYYCLFDFIWLLIAALFHLPSEASAYGTVAMLVLSSVTVAVGFLNTKKLRLPSYRLSFENSGSVYRIALISDLHLGAFVGADHVRKIVATINSVHPDLVIIAGDLIDDDNSILSDREELDRVSGEFCKLQSAHGIILTLGNHDPEATDAEFLKFLERSQITLLHNKHLELPSINVIGRTDPTRNYREPLDRLMLGVNRSKPTVAVDHDPQYIDELAAQAIELVLAGHTHGGQFFPATTATHFAYGRNKYYGCHKIKHTHAIISSGAGFFNLPVRIATRNEVVDLILDV